LSFIETYKELYLKDNSFITRRVEQLKAGLSKLEEASDYVADLMTELQQKELVLAEYTDEADNILREVGTSCV
jgi:predicted glycosyltransferase